MDDPFEMKSFLDMLYLSTEAEMASGLDRIPKKGRPSALEKLEAEALSCTACPLAEHRNKVVFGSGDPQAALLFVGEGPGREEDLQGLPFVGRAGSLLTRMIQAMDLTREKVYIANVVKCRPPNNRTPTPIEVNKCRRFLEEQIRLISPRVIVALGAPAARTLLEREEGISALRGRTFPYPKIETIRVVPTFHPAYLLRNESEKGKAWKDLKEAMRLLKE